MNQQRGEQRDQAGKALLAQTTRKTIDRANKRFNLKAAVAREKAVQALDVHRECTNCVVTF